MQPQLEIVRLAAEIGSRLSLCSSTVPAVRAVRREFSARIARLPHTAVMEVALILLEEPSDRLRFFTFELIAKHKQAAAVLTPDDLAILGRGLNSWSSVDCFALYLSGPMFADGRLSARQITAWARSHDLWWRRAALVSTVPLARRGDPRNLPRILRLCILLTRDRDDMVVKALSWALRETAKKQPAAVAAFLAEHHKDLAPRVVREVNNKLTTGLKTPRRPTML